MPVGRDGAVARGDRAAGQRCCWARWPRRRASCSCPRPGSRRRLRSVTAGVATVLPIAAAERCRRALLEIVAVAAGLQAEACVWAVELLRFWGMDVPLRLDCPGVGAGRGWRALAVRLGIGGLIVTFGSGTQAMVTVVLAMRGGDGAGDGAGRGGGAELRGEPVRGLRRSGRRRGCGPCRISRARRYWPRRSATRWMRRRRMRRQWVADGMTRRRWRRCWRDPVRHLETGRRAAPLGDPAGRAGADPPLARSRARCCRAGSTRASCAPSPPQSSMRSASMRIGRWDGGRAGAVGAVPGDAGSGGGARGRDVVLRRVVR